MVETANKAVGMFTLTEFWYGLGALIVVGIVILFQMGKCKHLE